MKATLFALLLCLTASCAQVLNPNASRTGVVDDNGHVIGSIEKVHAKKGVVIEIENDIEYDGTLKSNQVAKQKGVKADNGVTPNLTGE